VLLHHCFGGSCGEVHAVAIGVTGGKSVLLAKLIEGDVEFFFEEFVASVEAHFAHGFPDAPAADEVAVGVF